MTGWLAPAAAAALWAGILAWEVVGGPAEGYAFGPPEGLQLVPYFFQEGVEGGRLWLERPAAGLYLCQQ